MNPTWASLAVILGVWLFVGVRLAIRKIVNKIQRSHQDREYWTPGNDETEF